MDFSERLRNARHSKNLTQQQLADALNVDRTAIAHYERGTARPHFDNIHKLCELLDLTYEDIFDE
ncbi:MAG TPA: transcriptional regulator [Ruminococcaceae bacterium]|nr:transcriptional regulator [Oscillospiraceae bacterium]